jgi:hypothetical protein
MQVQPVAHFLLRRLLQLRPGVIAVAEHNRQLRAQCNASSTCPAAGAAAAEYQACITVFIMLRPAGLITNMQDKRSQQLLMAWAYPSVLKHL